MHTPRAPGQASLPFLGIKLMAVSPPGKAQMFNFRLADVSLLAEVCSEAR